MTVADTLYSARMTQRAGYEFYGCHDNKLLHLAVSTCDPMLIYTLQGCQSLLSVTHTTVNTVQANPADSMEQKPSSEANTRSDSQEIPCLLWNTKIQYRVCKSPPLVPIPNQMNPILTYTRFHEDSSCQYIAILPSTPSSKWSLPFRFSD
jgi:hypothetical protein